MTITPVTNVLGMLGSVFGALNSSVQLLHGDVLASQLVSLLQRLFPKAMNVCSLLGKLSAELADRCCLAFRAARGAGSGIFQNLLLLLQSLQER